MRASPGPALRPGPRAHPGRHAHGRTAAASAVARASPASTPSPAPCPLLGVHQLTFVGQWSADDAPAVTARAAAAGFGLLELNLSVPADVGRCIPATRAALQAAGMVACGSLGLSVATDIGSSDADARAAGVALLRDAIDVVASLAAPDPGTAAPGPAHPYLCGVTYGAIHKYAHGLSADQRAHVVAGLKEVTSYAADRGVGYGLEVINRYETNVLNTVAQAYDLIDDLGAPPNVNIHLDTYHAQIEEAGGPAAAVRAAAAGGRLGYVHVGESHRGFLGTGSIEWGPFFRSLVASGYSGPLTFESFSSAVVSPTLSNALCVWRDLWDDSDELASNSAAFMRAQWAAAARAEAGGVKGGG